MTYDKNYSGSAGTTGSTTGTTGTTGAGYGRAGSFGGGQSSGYGSSQGFGSSQGYGSPYSSGYENWSGNWNQPAGAGNKMLLGLLVGAAAGAAVALLMAPTTGREARQHLGRWARDTRHKATEAAGNLRQRFGQQQEGFGGASTQSGTGMNAPLNEDRNIPEL